MFCKRQRTEISPEIFISMPARVMAILQLCLAFTVIAWHAGTPFAGDLYATKTKLAIYQHVMGIKNPTYARLYKELPQDQQDKILDEYAALIKQSDHSYGQKLKKSLEKLIEMPLTEIGWLLLSIVIPIMLLKRVEGAVQAVWLVPVAMLCFAIDNRWHAAPPPRPADEHLFPKEEYIIQHYVKKPLSPHIFEQHTQLSKGWNAFLIREWAHEVPSTNSELFQQQLEKGDFAFQHARLALITPTSDFTPGQTKYSYYFWGVALFWNLSFAIIIWSLLFKKQEHANPHKIPY